MRRLKNKKKRRSIFSYLKDQNRHFYFLQETYSELKDEIIWKSEWVGEILYSHGTNRKKGGFQIEYSCNDSQGRIILANININSVQISLCNIYAPNNLQVQNTFVKDLNQFLLSNANVSQLIVGGDWNVALGAIDKKGGILRKKKPNAKLFTKTIKTAKNEIEN